MHAIKRPLDLNSSNLFHFMPLETGIGKSGRHSVLNTRTKIRPLQTNYQTGTEFIVPFSGYDCYSFAADLQNRLKIVPMVPKTVKATSGLRSKESKTGGITLRKRLKYGSDRTLIADKSCLSQGILGKRVSKHLSDNTQT